MSDEDARPDGFNEEIWNRLSTGAKRNVSQYEGEFYHGPKCPVCGDEYTARLDEVDDDGERRTIGYRHKVSDSRKLLRRDPKRYFDERFCWADA